MIEPWMHGFHLSVIAAPRIFLCPALESILFGKKCFIQDMVDLEVIFQNGLISPAEPIISNVDAILPCVDNITMSCLCIW